MRERYESDRKCYRPGIVVPKPLRYRSGLGAEYKLTRVRETPLTDELMDEPEKARAFFRSHVETAPWFDTEKECRVVSFLNARRRVLGFHLITLGTLDTCLMHPREVFWPAIVAGAGAIIVMHNHPSGDPSPSEADIKATRDLIRAGQLLKIELLDHIIAGTAAQGREKDYCSLRELGYFYS